MSELLRVRSDALEWLEVEGQVIALDLRNSVYLSVNPAGSSATRPSVTWTRSWSRWASWTCCCLEGRIWQPQIGCT
jgi:hypothetical protein